MVIGRKKPIASKIGISRKAGSVNFLGRNTQTLERTRTVNHATEGAMTNQRGGWSEKGRTSGMQQFKLS